MSALSIVSRVWPSLGLTQAPSTVFGSTAGDIVEIKEILNECVRQVRNEHQWTALTKQATITGDGSALSFDLPDDYDYMPQGQSLWKSTLHSSLRHIQSLDEWLALEVQSYDHAWPSWIMYDNQIHVRPVLGSSETVRYFYQSTKCVLEEDGTTERNIFGNDTDTFKLDERLLRLLLIRKYREDKSLSFEDAEQDYRRALGRAIMRDGGDRTVVVGPHADPRGVALAYPKTIIG